jgi:hypothetical protein
MNILIGVGISQKKDPFLAGQEAASLALYQIHHQPVSLVFVFATIHFSHQRLLDGIKYTLGDTKMLGSSGAGLITSAGVIKYGAGVMLISAEKLKFGLGSASEAKSNGPRETALAFGRDALKNLGTAERHLAFTISDGLIENGSELLRGLKDALGVSFPIFGFSSADNLRFLKTFQFFNGQLLTDSVIGAVFASKDVFGMGLRHGWKPLGKPHTITQANGNVIKTINGKPAVAIYEEYFNKSRQEVIRTLVRMSTYYPLGLYIPGEAEYILRNAIRVDGDGGLVCQGDAVAGSEARLMMGTKEWALEAAVKASQEAKEALKNRPLKGALVFESIARNKLLGRLSDNETAHIKNILGDIPLLGLCTFGEQAPLKSMGILTIGEP